MCDNDVSKYIDNVQGKYDFLAECKANGTSKNRVSGVNPAYFAVHCVFIIS